MKAASPSRISAALLLILFAASVLLLILFGVFAVYAFILMQFSLLLPAIVQVFGLALATHFKRAGRPTRASLALFFGPFIGLGAMIIVQELSRS